MAQQFHEGLVTLDFVEWAVSLAMPVGHVFSGAADVRQLATGSVVGAVCL